MSVFSTETIRSTTPPALAPERPVEWPRRTVRTLANGLKVVLAELRTFPKISAQLFFRSGNAAIAHTSPGLAEMTATVVRTGTANAPQPPHRRRSAAHGRRFGHERGSGHQCNFNFTGLRNVPTGCSDWLLTWRATPSFPADEFERERRQRLEELRIERTTPGFLAGERLRRVLFGAHPYAIIAPTEAQLAAYRREELESFYRQHYSPANAFAHRGGRFFSRRMLEQIEKIFGLAGAGARGDPARQRLRSARPPRLSGAFAGKPCRRMCWWAIEPSRGAIRIGGVWLANSIYGGAFHSRLVMNIREQKGYTYSPRSSVQPLRQHGYFTVHAAVRNEVVAATLTEMFYEADRMRSLPVGGEELADAQSYSVRCVFRLVWRTQDGLIGQLSGIYLNELPEDYLETYREKIRALNANDVLTAARKYFDSGNAQIVVVGDREQISRAGRAVRRSGIVRRPGRQDIAGRRRLQIPGCEVETP